MASPAAVPPPPPAQPNRAARRHPPNNGRGYVGIAEAATYLGVTPKTVRKLIAARELAAYRLRHENAADQARRPRGGVQAAMTDKESPQKSDPTPPLTPGPI